jgi:hypothetical protein
VSPLARLLIGKRISETVELDGREIEIVANPAGGSSRGMARREEQERRGDPCS